MRVLLRAVEPTSQAGGKKTKSLQSQTSQDQQNYPEPVINQLDQSQTSQDQQNYPEPVINQLDQAAES